MSENLCSVGLDVGTTTTQLVVSALTVENRASSFAVPQMEITGRQVVYESPVHFTPLLDKDRVDALALRHLLEEEYRLAGISREQVDTGAVIITGETSRKENAQAVLENCADLMGDFVVATAGPDLESILAAKGAGATEYSENTGKDVLHIDIGGGTSNMALIRQGKVLRTGCLNVGGRLIKLDEKGMLCYRSPVLEGLWDVPVGSIPTGEELKTLAELLTRALEMAAGLTPADDLLAKLQTREVSTPWQIPEPGAVLSFSGGVADCIDRKLPDRQFGDLGPLLGSAIKKSLLCQGPYVLGKRTIRATVIGAGCYTTSLSGSTVYYKNIRLPLKNLPVCVFTKQEQEAQDLPEIIARRVQNHQEEAVVLAFPGYEAAGYDQVRRLGRKIAQGLENKPVFVCLQGDMAKALGQRISLERSPEEKIFCIDGIAIGEESYLDVGSPVGPCLPVVIKTLVLPAGRMG